MPPSSGKTTAEQKPDKPDARVVSQETAEQFSSLLHKKKQPGLKESSKSKRETNQSSDKTEIKTTRQTRQVKIADHPQFLSRPSKQERPAEQPSPADKQSDKPKLAPPNDHENLPESLDLSRPSKQETPAEQPLPADKQSDKPKSAPPNDHENLPESLDAFDIAAMIAKSQPLPQSTVSATQTAPPPSADLSTIVGEIADRILVSTPDYNPAGGQEIRIHLKESVLPNTEVRIYRHAGSLQVEFMTTSKDSQGFVEQRQSDIQKVLNERLAGETVQVSVRDSQQARGGQGEGRARQQYVNPDQDDDNI